MTETPAAPTRLFTARLLLERPTRADADEIFARYASDPDVTTFLSWPTHRSVADTHAFVTFNDAEWDSTGVGGYLIRELRAGRLIGGTGLSRQSGGHGVTGYVLARDAWGQGYATEALAAMVDLAGRIGITRVLALCHVEHVVSRRVLEKGGFVLNDAWSGHVTFPNLPSDALQGAVCFVREIAARSATRPTAPPGVTSRVSLVC